MNREIKPETEGQERRDRADTSPRPARPQQSKAKRTSPATYLHEVRDELRRVAWPSAKEVRSYSLVVLVVVTLLMFYVFLLDQGIGQVVFQIFG